jgi:hypothetical protein
MAKLSEHQAAKFVKLLFIGDSGTGKTGALTSLVKDGYKLRILDLDNGLDALRQWVGHECKDKMDKVDFITLRDSIRATQQGPLVSAKAYIQALKLMSEWDDGSKPAEDGEKSVFVLDSLTALGKAAFEWAKASQPSAKDPRQWYFAAQQSVENVIGLLTSESFATNVIVISHINYRELTEGVHKGYPSAVGSAMGPTIPKYFNTMLQAEVQGSGKNTKRLIRTVPTAVIDLKNPAPFKMEAQYELGTGLAEIFKSLKEV